MAWYSLLPPHLTFIETWVIRICFVLAFINLSPWLIAILFDVTYYLARFIWYYVPVYGGKAQGEARPRAPSLADSKRRRTLSLTGLINGASPDRVGAEHKAMRQRHARTMSDRGIAEESESHVEDGG